MVTFAEVGTFFRRNPSSRKTKKEMTKFFRALRCQRLSVLGLDAGSVRGLFSAASTLGVESIFLCALRQQEENYKTSTLYHRFEQLWDLAYLQVFLHSFLRFNQEFGGLPTDEDCAALDERAGQTIAGFLICRDHEGPLPILVHSHHISPALALCFLECRMNDRFLAPR